QETVHRCPGAAHQARGVTGRAGRHIQRLRRRRAARPRAGWNPVPGRALPCRGPESEEAEGDPAGARVHPVTVPGREYQLHRVDRRGQVSLGGGSLLESPPAPLQRNVAVSARLLCWERENTMRARTGFDELRERARTTWIEQEHGWVAAPEEAGKARAEDGVEACERQTATSGRDPRPAGG